VSETPSVFERLVDDVTVVSQEIHRDVLVAHAESNKAHIGSTIRDLPSLEGAKAQSGFVISAGPSVHRQQSILALKEHGYPGTVIAVDGAYIACLKKGLIPDYVITLDPHPTRMVRWFGDHDFEEHTRHDDYFSRQDLDIEFRKSTIEQNRLHIQLVNEHGHKSKALVSSSAPANVVARLQEAGMATYWWNPLVDDPSQPGSLTRQLYDVNRLPSVNTGGNVGTAAWVFASSIFKLPVVGMAGMDYGYYGDLPWEKTQKYYELIERLGGTEHLADCFVEFEFPLTGDRFYTDPTYFWYRRNFLELLRKSTSRNVNCTGGGTLFGENLECATLETFLDSLRS